MSNQHKLIHRVSVTWRHIKLLAPPIYSLPCFQTPSGGLCKVGKPEGTFLRPPGGLLRPRCPDNTSWMHPEGTSRKSLDSFGQQSNPDPGQLLYISVICVPFGASNHRRYRSTLSNASKQSYLSEHFSLSI